MAKFRKKQKMEAPKTCYLRFELERSCLVIYAFDPHTTRSKHVARGEDSIDKINDLSRMYRSLVALRSFAEENDQGVISFTQRLGKQLYALGSSQKFTAKRHESLTALHALHWLWKTGA